MEQSYLNLIERNQIDHMPQIVFRLNVYAPSFSGKSYMINDLLTNPKYGYSKIFKPEQIYILSPTFESDESYNTLREVMKNHKNNIRDDYDEDFLKEIVNKQKLTKNSKRAKPIIILIDDLVTKIDRHKAKELIDLYYKGRHLFINIILTSQKYKEVPPAIRVNSCSNIYFTNAMNKGEINQIEQDQTSDIFKDCVINLRKFNYFQYDFIYVNLKMPFDKRYYRNFDTVFQE
jgi:hypothetical protein